MISITSQLATLARFTNSGQVIEKQHVIAKLRMAVEVELDTAQLVGLCGVEEVGEACGLLVSASANNDKLGAMGFEVKGPFGLQNLTFSGGSMEESVVISGVTIALTPKVRFVEGLPTLTMKLDCRVPVGLLADLSCMVDHDKVALTMQSAQQALPMDDEPVKTKTKRRSKKADAEAASFH